MRFAIPSVRMWLLLWPFKLCVFKLNKIQEHRIFQIVHENWKFAHTDRDWVWVWLKKITRKTCNPFGKMVFLLIDRRKYVQMQLSSSPLLLPPTIKYVYKYKIDVSRSRSALASSAKNAKSNMNKWREKLMNLTSVKQNIYTFDPECFHVFFLVAVVVFVFIFLFVLVFGYFLLGWFCCKQRPEHFSPILLITGATDDYNPASHSTNIFFSIFKNRVSNNKWCDVIWSVPHFSFEYI